MGAQGSKPDHEASPDLHDQSFFASRSQPFSESLINHLQSQSTPSSAVPASRQQALDQHIQQRLASELHRLRQEEHAVRDEIERALEKENLDRERGADQGEGQGGKALPHSASLIKDLEDLEKRALALRKERAETDDWKRVDVGKEQLVKCFRDNKTTPLNCREQAEAFKQAVAGIESAFFQTVHAGN
ncbi:hypothetical protein JCM10449v2_002382 [Rhodotorula kratochvilovae]